MKKLLLIRHAKSSWADFSQPDFERPLNERGQKDAPKMAKRLAEKDIIPDVLVSSPANRAITTAMLFAKTLDIKKKHILEKQDLYLAPSQNFYDIIELLDDSYNTVAIFAHNPGITGFANELTHVHIDEMPTCSVFAVRMNIKEWKHFREAEKSFWFFDYPKNI